MGPGEIIGIAGIVVAVVFGLWHARLAKRPVERQEPKPEPPSVDLRVSYRDYGRGFGAITIRNDGTQPALDVALEIPEPNPIPANDETLPYPALEQGESVTVRTAWLMGGSPPWNGTLRWSVCEECMERHEGHPEGHKKTRHSRVVRIP